MLTRKSKYGLKAMLELAQHADELCVLNGMYTDLPAHGNATLMMHTGNFRFIRPSMSLSMLRS